MSEKKQLLPNKNNAKIQQRNAKIQKSSTPSSADDSTSDPIESIPGTSTSSGILRQAEKNRCENCKDCICRLWRSNLTPEYATLFRIQSESMNKYLSKKNQLIIRNLKVELYPNTGIFLPEVELNLALSKSNNKHRELVRQLLSIIVTEDELIVYKTAENMNKVNSNLRNAIIGYLKKECNVSLSTVEFNDIVRRKIGQAILNKKPKEEIEIAKQKSIERAQKSRNKRKLLHPETDDSTKKTKENRKESDSTFVIPISPTKWKYESHIDDPVPSTSGILKTYPGKRTSIAGPVLSTSCDIPEKRPYTDNEIDSLSSTVSSTVMEMPTNSELILLRDKCKKLELQAERLRKILKTKNCKIFQLKRKASGKNSTLQQWLHRKRSASNTESEGLRKSHKTAKASQQGSDKEENLTLLSDSKPEEERCDLLPEEISESGAEEVQKSDVESAQLPNTAYFSPSSSAEVYNTDLPSCLSSSNNWLPNNETELETSSLGNPSLLPGVINDVCSKFFQTMADTVRDLPRDLQILAKRDVLHAVTEFELTALKRLNVPKN